VRRWQASRFWTIAAVVVIAVVAIFAFRPFIDRKVLGNTPPGVTQLSDVAPLKAAFNRDAGSTRLILIFSPT
jgi:hypothetical protein